MFMSRRFPALALAVTALMAAPVLCANAQLPQVSVYGARVATNTLSACTFSSGNPPGKITRDAAGNLFVLDVNAKCVVEIPVSGPMQVVIPSTDPSMTTVAPASITADPAGNLYVVHNSVTIQTILRNTNGTYNLAGETSSTPFSGLTNNYYDGNDIAVDSLGNIYASSSSGNAVAANGWTGQGIMMYGPSTGNVPKYLVEVASTSTAYPVSLQVDAAGDVFYADGAKAYEITAATVASVISSGTALATGTAIGTGNVVGTSAAMSTPKFVYLDNAGNLYVGNNSSAVYVIVNNAGFSASSTVYALPGTSSNGPIAGKTGYNFGAVDNQGNLWLDYGGSVEYYGGGRMYIATSPYYVGGTVAVAAVAQSATTTPSGASYGLLFNASTTLNSTSANYFVGSADGSAYGGAGAAESTYNTGSNTTCVAGTTYTAGQSCVIEVGYGPFYPGFFATGFNLYNSSGNLLTTIYANGIATGPAAVIDTGVATAVGTGYTAPLGVAVDNKGAMYVADPGSNAVYKYAAGASTATAGTAIGSGLSSPSGVAVDAGGNVFIANTGANNIVYLPNNSGTLGTQVVLTTTGYTLNAPRGIAVDSYGNLYVSDTGNSRVLLVPNPLISAVGKVTTVGSGFTSPYGIAIDAYNNVYVADKGAGKVYEVPGGYALTQSATTNVGPGTITTVGTFSAPTGVAVDGSGTVYVADGSLAQVVKVPYTAGAFGTQTALFTAAATGISSPAGIAIDRTGDLYFTDNDQPNLYFAQRSEPSAATKIALPLPDSTTSSSTTANLVLSNAGLTTALTESVTTSPASPFSLSTNGCNGASVAAGASCTDTITFAGASAAAADTSNAGSLVFTDNTLNATTSPTTPVTLNGVATSGVSTVTISGDASVTYGASETYTVQALDSGSKPSAAANGSYSVAVKSGSTTVATASVTLTDGTGSFLLPTSGVNVGSYTLSTTVSGTVSNSLAVTVGKAPLTAMASNVSRLFDVANPTFTYSLVGLANGDTSSVVTGSATVATSATRVSPAGTYTLTPSGSLAATNYTLSYAPGTLTVTGSVPQAILFTPLPVLTHGTAYTLTGLATSGLPVGYTATNASVSGNVITPTAAGAVTVTAIQPGNGTYASATPVSRSFTAQ